MVRLPSRADRQDQSGCEVNDAFRPRPLVGEAFSPSRNGPVWTSNSDLEIPERVRFQAVGIGAVCGEHACVDGCPISARASRVHAGRVTWPQNDGFAVAFDMELAFHNEGRLGVGVEVLPTAALQFPFRE